MCETATFKVVNGRYSAGPAVRGSPSGGQISPGLPTLAVWIAGMAAYTGSIGSMRPFADAQVVCKLPFIAFDRQRRVSVRSPAGKRADNDRMCHRRCSVVRERRPQVQSVYWRVARKQDLDVLNP